MITAGKISKFGFLSLIMYGSHKNKVSSIVRKIYFVLLKKDIERLMNKHIRFSYKDKNIGFYLTSSVDLLLVYTIF
jgi:UDP-N-acetylenolpyruvoylglucosamine reductase